MMYKFIGNTYALIDVQLFLYVVSMQFIVENNGGT